MVAGTTMYPPGVAKGPVPGGAGPALPPRDWSTFELKSLDGMPRRWAFPSMLDNPTSPWLQTLKRLYAWDLTFPASISPDGGMLLHALIRNQRPKVVIETGTFLGVSAIWIASALAENGDGGVLHCFDDFVPIRPGPWREAELRDGVLDRVASHIAEAGLREHVVLHPGNCSHEIRASHDELRQDAAKRGVKGVQAAYLDADHRPMGVCQDFWATEPLLELGGLVVLHDTFPENCGDTGPRFLLDHVAEVAAARYQTMDLYLSPVNYGMGVLRRIG